MFGLHWYEPNGLVLCPQKIYNYGKYLHLWINIVMVNYVKIIRRLISQVITNCCNYWTCGEEIKLSNPIIDACGINPTEKYSCILSRAEILDCSSSQSKTALSYNTEVNHNNRIYSKQCMQDH